MSWLLSSRLRFLKHLRDQGKEGQGLVEYALILLLICIACLVAITALGDTIVENLWSLVQDVLIPALGI
jgi:Flp pilus assembly pilin Flp